MQTGHSTNACAADFKNSLAQRIQNVLATHNTEGLQKMLGDVAKNLSIQPLELAAALLHLDADLIASCHAAAISNASPPTQSTDIDLKKQLAEQFATALNLPEIPPEKHKMVRYRIEIGHNHHVSIDDIKNVLINESGVDRSKIGFMDIRSNYTLIDLPLGMPPDIFQLLQTVEIKQHALQIKRVNASRKRPWQRRKGTGQNRANEREANVADTPMRR
jgi:hypothetical protein